jgi:hypothetical protein
MMAKLKRKPRKPRKLAAKKPFDWRSFKATDYVAEGEQPYGTSPIMAALPRARAENRKRAKELYAREHKARP